MPYRDLEALRARHAVLNARLAELGAQTRELADLKAEEASVRRELAETAALLGRKAEKRALPMLDGLRIASPCSESWDDMLGDERTRFCTKCAKDVHNVSAMAKEEAEALLRERAGDVCVRYYQRTDGTILTSDCPVGVRRKRVRRIAALAVTVGAGAAAAAWMAAPRARMGAAMPPASTEAENTTTPPTAAPPMVPTGAPEVVTVSMGAPMPMRHPPPPARRR